MRHHLCTVLVAAAVAVAVTIAAGDGLRSASTSVMSTDIGGAASALTSRSLEVGSVASASAASRARQALGCPLASDNVCIEPERFHTTHSLRTKTGDGRDLVVLSGYAEIDGDDLRGNANGTWNRRGLVFRVGPRWRNVDTVPVVSMTSIMNLGVATNAGWAVDNCKVITTPGGRETLQCRVAVRDSDGFMFRVNYYVTMVCRLA